MQKIIVLGGLATEKIDSQVLKAIAYQGDIVLPGEVDAVGIVEKAINSLELPIEELAKLEIINLAQELIKKRIAKESAGEIKEEIQAVFVEQLTPDSEINEFFDSINDKIETAGEVAEKATGVVENVKEGYEKVKPLVRVVKLILTGFKLFKK